MLDPDARWKSGDSDDGGGGDCDGGGGDCDGDGGEQNSRVDVRPLFRHENVP